jgi:hypothetical protein
MGKPLALCCSVVEKISQTEPNEKHAQECIEILFEPKKPEHYGSFQCFKNGTRTNVEKCPALLFHWLF